MIRERTVDRRRHLIPPVALITLTLGVFAINWLVRTDVSYLGSDEIFAQREVRCGTPPDYSLFGENLSDPYRARFLFRFVLVGIHRLLGHSTITEMRVLFGALCLLLSISISLTLLVTSQRVFGLTPWGGFLAALLWVVSLTHLNFFEYPCHGFEDLWCFEILLLGLAALQTQRRIPLHILMVAGVLSRETMLTLPLIWVLHRPPGSGALHLRALGAIPYPLLCAVHRIILGGGIEYDMDLALQHNLHSPWAAVGFALATFGALWLLAPFAWWQVKGLRGTPLHGWVAAVAVLTIAITTALGGRFIEHRVLFLAFPWMLIPAAAFLTEADWHAVRWGRFTRFAILMTLATGIHWTVALHRVQTDGIDLRTALIRMSPGHAQFVRVAWQAEMWRAAISLFITAPLALCLLVSGLRVRDGAGGRQS
ncbi:hypothetical protein JXA47_15340 [Candidatus Sumerlaeota bacterium]|nr:hypothetical protein [Candidatus Sumerlaeota bacterium]